MGGVELLSKRVGRERGKNNTHTYTREGGERGRQEREGEKRKKKKKGWGEVEEVVVWK